MASQDVRCEECCMHPTNYSWYTSNVFCCYFICCRCGHNYTNRHQPPEDQNKLPKTCRDGLSKEAREPRNWFMSPSYKFGG
jgi:hypothetical protein